MYVITLSVKSYYFIKQEHAITQQLLHYQAVYFITLSGTYNINRRLLYNYIIIINNVIKMGESSQIATNLSSEVVVYKNTFVAAICGRYHRGMW